MKLQVTAGFILLVVFLLFTDNNGIFMWFTVVMMIHEAGHLLALLLLGGRITSCRLSLWGACITADGLSYSSEIAAVLTGPAFSLLAAVAASYAGLAMPAGLSLVAGVYNLLPARCLDGGRALELAVAWTGRPHTAEQLVRVTTLLSAAMLCVPLCISIAGGVYNWTLLLSAVFVGVSAFVDF